MATDAEKGRHIVDPVLFQQTLLRRTIWRVQQEIARSVDENVLTAVKGCHASGKSFLASGIPLHWITKHRKSLAFTISPTHRQVIAFWQEVRLARENALPILKRALPEPNQTSLVIADDRQAMGASSSRGVNLQGRHAENVLVVVDESPGVPADIFDAIHGIRAGGNVHALLLGNPVVPAGEFFDAFHRGRNSYNCISIGAFDTPNLQNELTGQPLTIEELLVMDEDRLNWCPFPALISRRWVKERYLAWGPNHPKYMSRVLAQFPTQADNAVFALTWIEAAKREPTEKELRDALRLQVQVGIDVAGAGSDETVLTARVGGIILEMHAWPDPDPRGPVLRVLQSLKRHPLYQLGIVVIDTVGIGYNFALHVADQGFQVYGFRAGSRPIDAAMYANQKAEATWHCREWFKGGHVSGLGLLTSKAGMLVPEEETEAQLSTMLYRETGRGLTEIIPKEEMLKLHGIPSPDRAESVIMAFAKIVPQVQSEVYESQQFQISSI